MKTPSIIHDFKELYLVPECNIFNVIEPEIICSSNFVTEPIDEDPDYVIF